MYESYRFDPVAGSGTLRKRAISLGIACISALGVVIAQPLTADAHHADEHWTVPTVIVRDETGIAEYRRAIAMAAARWNAAGSAVRLDVRDGLGRGCDAPSVGNVAVCRADLPSTTAGEARVWVDGDHIIKGSVLIDAGARPFEHLVAIACHELGHALGMDHRAERSSCLTATIHSSDPDAHDRAELRRTHGHSHPAPAPQPDKQPGGQPGERCPTLVRHNGQCVNPLVVLSHRH